MKISKYINIDENILIEYIHDDSNLIGESYNILYNTQTGVKCFVSSDEPRPSTKGLKQTNNDLISQLYRVNYVQNRYCSIPLSTFPNKIDANSAPFLQVRNFATSIPIRYDIIRVHVPVNYVFDSKKGFYLRVYTYNFDNTKEVELSNYAFNMTDVDQSFQLEFSSPILHINSRQWGKYVQLQIPSVTKVSDQRLRNLPRANSINFNLSPGGVGLSKTSPVFIDFHYIDRINDVNGVSFFDLSPKKTIVVPQTPEFEKLGVKIEESSQGDFFLLYGTYNGTLGDFENFIEDQYYEGNRYYLEFIVEIFERNVKIKTTTFIVKENFGEEIEYRPILKYTTTTAVIDVTMRLINSVDSTFIERKSSYGLLQGGGAKMGAEPNSRLNTANGSGGAGDISKYARYLRKINLQKATKQDVFYIKSSQLANSESSSSPKGFINFKKIPFILFSFNYYLLDNDTNFRINGINYLANNRAQVYITPFDDFIKVKVIKTNYFEELVYNLETFANIKLTIRSDQKNLNFDIYKDSPDNIFSEGKLVFKVPQEKYADIKTIYNQGFNNFFINGVDPSGVKKIIYTAFYIPWDSPDNLNKLLVDYDTIQSNAQSLLQTTFVPVDPTLDVINAIDDGTNIDTTVNTNPEITPIDTVSSRLFNPRWKSNLQVLEIAFGNRNTFSMPLRRDMFIIANEIPELKFELESKSSQIQSLNNPMQSTVNSTNDKKLDLIIGYFKGLNLNPKDYLSYWFSNTNSFGTTTTTVQTVSPLQRDLLVYVNSGLSGKLTNLGMGIIDKDVIVGEYLPNAQQFKQLKNEKITKNLNFDQIFNKTTMSKDAVSNDQKKEIFYSPNQIPQAQANKFKGKFK